MEKNNKIAAPMAHYTALYKNLDPHFAAARCDIAFENGVFALTLFGKPINITFPEFHVYNPAEPDVDFPYDVALLLIRYILEGAGGNLSGKFLSYSEIPWGQVYLENFKGRCLKRLAFSFGFDLPRFERACIALGGVAVEGSAKVGDASYDIEFLGGLIIRVILWAPDEEFPPNSQILFSDNFPMAFSAEDLSVVGDVLINALKRVK